MNDLAKYLPDKASLELRKVNSIELCLNSNTPSLANIKNENGENKIIDLIQIWIIDMNDFLNVSRKMNESQIKQTAQLILQDFFYLKIADINLVFQNAKRGIYGNLYESLDGLKIYQWFEQYALQRGEISYQTNLKQHNDIKYLTSRDR